MAHNIAKVAGYMFSLTKTYMSLDGLSNLPFRQRKKNEVLRLHFVLVAGEGFAVALHCHSTDGQTKTGATCRFVGLNPKVSAVGYMAHNCSPYNALAGFQTTPSQQKNTNHLVFLLVAGSGFEPLTFGL